MSGATTALLLTSLLALVTAVAVPLLPRDWRVEWMNGDLAFAIGQFANILLLVGLYRLRHDGRLSRIRLLERVVAVVAVGLYLVFFTDMTLERWGLDLIPSRYEAYFAIAALLAGVVATTPRSKIDQDQPRRFDIAMGE